MDELFLLRLRLLELSHEIKISNLRMEHGRRMAELRQDALNSGLAIVTANLAHQSRAEWTRLLSDLEP